ncbi:MAG: PAS domain-containing sensor histidine kinase [Gemmatimonadota bacterium]|nr:PAS domain-containing sensor histidine kinase [Gemmatimonadota bacterium]
MPHASTEAELAVKLFPETEMGRLYRATGWSATPLGSLSSWPLSLRTASAMVLRQGLPQALCWGPELHQIYNDGYRVILGDKHPGALGAPVLETWAEIADEIAPLFASVWRGETVYFEDLHLRVKRHGRMEDAWFTFSYSPVIVESGEVGAVLVNCIETTAQAEGRVAQRERDTLLEQLKVERARLEATFRQSPSFFAILRGPENVFELVNDAYERAIGYGRSLVGKSLFVALPETRGQGFDGYIQRVRETGEPLVLRDLPVMLARSQGATLEQRFVDVTYLPLMEADGTHPAVIAHGTDVTEAVRARKALEASNALLQQQAQELERRSGALRDATLALEDRTLQAESARISAERARRDAEEAREAAELANRAKGEFLAVMSHELRTPLNAIGGYTELVELGIHGPVTADQAKALARVQQSQRHLLGLINGVLNYSRIEVGAVKYMVEPVMMDEVLTTCEALLAPQAHAKEISLVYAGCAPSVIASADREKVSQVILNLLTNAVKFTAQGGTVTLTCSAVGGIVRADVTDTGRGIPQDQLERVFQPFVQIDTKLTRTNEGTGLGLAISRQLAQGMRGDLAVASTFDVGSTFTLTLPRHLP